MKEIKDVRMIEEIRGYEANDGTFFKSKEECEKYEGTAKAVITAEFNRLVVGNEFSEYLFFEGFGSGCDDFDMAIIDIKDADNLHKVNMLCALHKMDQITSDYIGKRVLVSLGYGRGFDCNLYPRTEEELIEGFKAQIKKYFHPEDKERKESD